MRYKSLPLSVRHDAGRTETPIRPERPRPSRLKNWLATLPLLLLPVVLVVPMLTVTAQTPTLTTASPAIAGRPLTVNGAGFQPRDVVQLAWDGSTDGMPTVHLGAGHAFTVVLSVPNDAAGSGHVLSAARSARSPVTATGGGALATLTVPVVQAPVGTALRSAPSSVAPATPDAREDPSLMPSARPASAATTAPSTPKPPASAAAEPASATAAAATESSRPSAARRVAPTEVATPAGNAARAARTAAPTAAPTPAPTVVAKAPPRAPAGTLVVRPGMNLGNIANGAPDGATVTVESGTYAPFVLRNSNLTIREAPGHSAVVAGGTDAIEVNGSNNVIIEGLTVRGAAEYGIDVVESSNVTLRAVEATRNGTGIRVIGFNSRNVNVLGAALHTNDRMIKNTCGGNDDYGANGIKWRETNGPHAIRGSVLFANRAASCDYGTDGGAFEVWKASGVVIANNRAYDNNVTYEIGTAGGYVPQGISFVGNEVWHTGGARSAGMMIRAGRNTLISGNTFRDVDWWVFFVQDCASTFCAPIDGTRIEHNVVSGSTAYKIKTVLPGSVRIDHNRIVSPDTVVAEYAGTNFTSWLAFSKATGYDSSTAR